MKQQTLKLLPRRLFISKYSSSKAEASQLLAFHHLEWHLISRSILNSNCFLYRLVSGLRQSVTKIPQIVWDHMAAHWWTVFLYNLKCKHTRGVLQDRVNTICDGLRAKLSHLGIFHFCFIMSCESWESYLQFDILVVQFDPPVLEIQYGSSCRKQQGEKTWKIQFCGL